MVEISCLCLGYNYEHVPLILIFMKYEKFIKIRLKYFYKEVVIAIENLKYSEMLFDFYILSLLCLRDNCECTPENYDSYVFHSISIENGRSEYSKYCDYKLEEYEHCWMKENPFLSQEPKRQSSVKKINKLLKPIYRLYENGEFEHPLSMIETMQMMLIEPFYLEDFIRTEKEKLEMEVYSH